MKRDQVFCFTAYSAETGKRESFKARRLAGVDDSFMDAAVRHLTHCHCWSREELDAARIKICY